MRLIGVEMAGRHPFQVRLSEVRRDPAHDLADIGFHVEPIAMFRRDDEPEMMPVLAPPFRFKTGLNAIETRVEKLRPRAFRPGARSPEVGHMLGERGSPIGALAHVPARPAP